MLFRKFAHRPPRMSGSRRGFSILRVLVGLLILGIFGASVIPLRAMVTFQRLKRDALGCTKVISNMLKIGYRAQYGKLPLEVSSVGRDYYETTTNAALMAILLGTDKEANPLGLDFDFSKLVFIEGGCRLEGPPGQQRLLDPWGNEFNVRMDADADSHCGAIEGCVKKPNRMDPDPTRIRGEVIVWSKGRPKGDGTTFENCPMWLKSWE